MAHFRYCFQDPRVFLLNLKALRLERGLSLNSAARRLGWPVNRLVRLEQGKRPIGDLLTYLDALDYRVAILVDDPFAATHDKLYKLESRIPPGSLERTRLSSKPGKSA